MANRSYLYITDNVEKREKIRGIGEYNYDFPLLFKILCSSMPIPGKSSICDPEEKTAIISNMSDGIEKLKSFLIKMRDEKISLNKENVLVSDESYDKIAKFLDKNKYLDEGYRYFLMEGFELYEMEADSYENFENLTLRDIGKINNIDKDVQVFMETGTLNDSLREEIRTYEEFQYGLNSFSEYLYYDFSSTYDCETCDEEKADDERHEETGKTKKTVEKHLVGFDFGEIMFMIFFLIIFPPVGIYFCYDGFRGKYSDRFTSGIILGFLGTTLTLFYMWKILGFLIRII